MSETSVDTTIDQFADDDYEYIFSHIGNKEFVSFIKDVHSVYYTSTDTKAMHAIGATLEMIDRLKSLKLISDQINNKQCDMAITACMIHNVFFDRITYLLLEESECNMEKSLVCERIFAARFKLNEIVQKHINEYTPPLAFDYVFEIVEAQLGEDTPIQRCRPVQGQPTQILAEVLWWYYHEYLLHNDIEKYHVYPDDLDMELSAEPQVSN
jgi:hypothetical protein